MPRQPIETSRLAVLNNPCTYLGVHQEDAVTADLDDRLRTDRDLSLGCSERTMRLPWCALQEDTATAELNVHLRTDRDLSFGCSEQTKRLSWCALQEDAVAA